MRELKTLLIKHWVGVIDSARANIDSILDDKELIWKEMLVKQIACLALQVLDIEDHVNELRGPCGRIDLNDLIYTLDQVHTRLTYRNGK